MATTIVGFLTSYSILVLLLISGGLSFRESIMFPSIQITTLFNVIGDESFFGTLENPWYVATPLLMFHLVLICILILERKQSWVIFPPLLLTTLIIQILVLVIGQTSGFAVTFQSGFDAIIAYWPLAAIFTFLLLKVSDQKKLTLLLAVLSFVFIAISQLLVFTIRSLAPNLELILLSTGIPLVSLVVCILFFYYKKTSAFQKALALAIIIPLTAFHTLDYSYSFYTSQNTPMNYKSGWTAGEYEAASMTVKLFSESLRETTAIGAIEDPQNSLQTAMLRASSRAFSSCGFQWSRFESFEQFQSAKVDTWPMQVILGSYREISDSEFNQVFTSFKQIKRFEFEIQGQIIYWSLIQR